MAKRRSFTKPVALLVSDEIHKRILDICDRLEISISEWVRQAIDLKLDKEQEEPFN